MPWRKNSICGDGPRVRLDRNGRARFKFLVRLHRAAHRLTANDADVAEVLVSALGDDGRLDFAHATIAERALCHPAIVRRALGRLRDMGLVDWVRRLVRGPHTGWRCEQGSNAYVLHTPACDAQAARPVRKIDISCCRKPINEDAAARQSAVQQLLTLGFSAPAGWHEGRLLGTRVACRFLPHNHSRRGDGAGLTTDRGSVTGLRTRPSG